MSEQSSELTPRLAHSMSDSEYGGPSATIREVMAMVEQARRDVLSRVENLEVKVDSRLEAHYNRHETDLATHLVDHRREDDRRAGLLRWAVTTIMTGAGVLFTIIWALTH